MPVHPPLSHFPRTTRNGKHAATKGLVCSVWLILLSKSSRPSHSKSTASAPAGIGDSRCTLRRGRCIVRRMPRLELLPFRYRLTGKWAEKRYVAEGREYAARHSDWEIIGPPKIRDDPDARCDDVNRTGSVTTEAADVPGQADQCASPIGLPTAVLRHGTWLAVRYFGRMFSSGVTGTKTHR